MTNPNYVPVDWATTPGIGYDDSNCTMACHASLLPCPHEIEQQLNTAATLNSAGDPIKVGDRVHHIADVGAEKRSVGVVTYVGPVTILGTVVENGAGVQWDGAKKQESHHVDQLTVLL